jgi:DNA-binding GntR family transcriptional regulator
MPTVRRTAGKTKGTNGSPHASYDPMCQTADKLSERVYQALKRDIVTGILRPGEAVTENDLAGRYKSSRTPVREAALRLEEQNLLRNVPNRGYFVTHLTVKDLNDIYEYRLSVECTCAELAASKGIPSSNLPELNKLASRRSRPDSRSSFEEFIAADTAFHVHLARLTRNPLLVRAISEMRCQMERILFAGIDSLDTSYYYGDLPVHGHQGILRAIKGGNAKLAKKLMHEHIMSAKEEVIQMVHNGSRLI